MAKILVLGYGKMGQIYAKNLLSLGVENEDLIIVDKVPSLLSGLTPSIYASTSIDDALRQKPDVAFVLTNTNFHADHIARLLSAGVDHIFVEKPLVFRPQELGRITTEMRPQSKIFTAYLLNFSPAVGHLIRFMKENDLRVLEVRGVWGKNRSFDSRMTAGDLEDEAVHMIQLALMLSRQGMEVGGIDVSAMLSFLPYASPEAQAKGNAEDESVPLNPTSSTLAGMRLYPKRGEFETLCFFVSSYLSPLQTRFVDFVLGNSAGEPTHVGRISFDTGGKDSLFLQETGSKDEGKTSLEFPADGKIRAEVAAFLAVTFGKPANPRLTGFADAVLSVRLTEAFLKSDASGKTVEVHD